jgi:hypothetical protein
LHIVCVPGNAAEPVLHHVEAATTVAHHVSKMIVDPAETMTSTRTDHATTETISDLVATVEAVLAKPPVAESHVMTREAHRPKTATPIVAVIEPARAPVEAVEPASALRHAVVTTARAPGVQMASIDTYLDKEPPAKPLPPQQPRSPLSLASVTTVASAIVSATGAIEQENMTAGTAGETATVGPGLTASMSLIGIYLEAVAATTKLLRRKAEIGVGVATGRGKRTEIEAGTTGTTGTREGE